MYEFIILHTLKYVFQPVVEKPRKEKAVVKEKEKVKKKKKKKKKLVPAVGTEEGKSASSSTTTPVKSSASLSKKALAAESDLNKSSTDVYDFDDDEMDKQVGVNLVSRST